MKIYRPLWEDGAFLMPQQFQQQAAWDVHLADSVARMGLAHPWAWWLQSLMTLCYRFHG
ncbi:putative type VI secretion protein [Escherichia coli]|uniref:Putative type VI secretion protein n=1 Tax=Escherichia coli TaxID=562 RepID=A0A376L2L3_ECOLX|nr:putative type VI secretion protein [Escherichia coli]